MPKSSCRILITGGSGFIGTHLCRLLVSLGHQIRVLDLVPATDPVAGVEYLRGDIRNPSDLLKAMIDIDTVYHLAAIVSVPRCQEAPTETAQTNLLGTYNVIEAIEAEKKRTGSKTDIRLFFASSSAVYGDLGQENQPLSEEIPLREPLSFYAAQKLASEHAIRLASRSFGIPALVFRLFNVYGPGQSSDSPYSGVITLFTRAICEGKSLKLYNSGLNTRDFVSVHDVAEAMALALQAKLEFCDGRPINIGSGKSITVRKLAEFMLQLCNKKIVLENLAERRGDVRHSLADISRAKAILSWTPRLVLFEELSGMPTRSPDPK